MMQANYGFQPTNDRGRLQEETRNRKDSAGSGRSLTSLQRDERMDRLERDFRLFQASMRSDLDDVVTEMRMAGTKQEKLLENILAKITPNSAQSDAKEDERTAVPRTESPSLEVPLNLIVDDNRSRQLQRSQNVPRPGATTIGGRNTSTPVPAVYRTQSHGNLQMGVGLTTAQVEVHAHQGAPTG